MTKNLKEKNKFKRNSGGFFSLVLCLGKENLFVCYRRRYINNQCQSLLGYAWSAVGSCSVGHTQPSATHMYTTRSRQKLCWAGRTLPVWNRTLLGFKSVGAVSLPGSWPMMDAVTHTTSGCGSTQKPTVRPLCPKIFFFFNLQRFLFFLAFFSSVTATGICSVRSSTSTPVFFSLFGFVFVGDLKVQKTKYELIESKLANVQLVC